MTILPLSYSSFFFFNDTATTEIYTLSLHDALPISLGARPRPDRRAGVQLAGKCRADLLGAQPGRDSAGIQVGRDRKSTRLNSSHGYISYAVFCLKKKKKKKTEEVVLRLEHTRSDVC